MKSRTIFHRIRATPHPLAMCNVHINVGNRVYDVAQLPIIEITSPIVSHIRHGAHQASKGTRP